MIDWYPWLVLAHVAGAFGFVLAHGVSVFVAFRLRSVRDPREAATLLNLSSASMNLLYLCLLILLVAGIAAGFVGGWWGRLWIWLSLVLLVAIVVAMYAIGTRYYVAVRHAVGLSAPMDRKGAPAAEPVPAEDLAVLLDSRRPHLLAAIGGGGLLAILALMMLKPF